MVADPQGSRHQAGVSHQATSDALGPKRRDETHDAGREQITMHPHRRRFLILATAGAVPLLAPTARAQEFPTRPIRLVIPYPPGGIVDALGRPWAEKMKALLGAVVVENVGGGGGELAATTVARASPDGHTVLLGNSSVMVINPLAATHVSYDPVRSFDTVATLGHIALAITVHPSLPVHALQELAEYARRNPGRLSYGTPGVGSLNHLTGEQFRLLIGAPDIVHVPYRGAGPAIADLLGGQIPMSVTAVNGQLLELHRTGRLRILAVTSPQRLAAAPDLPTVAEGGMAGLTAQATTWLFVPKGTASGAIARISQATREALADPDLQRKYVAAGVEPSKHASPEAAARQLGEEIAHWRPVVQHLGLRLD
jgi:tripartite-type tricarboxylate transporter receptor subunit TctC